MHSHFSNLLRQKPKPKPHPHWGNGFLVNISFSIGLWEDSSKRMFCLDLDRFMGELILNLESDLEENKTVHISNGLRI